MNPKTTLFLLLLVVLLGGVLVGLSRWVPTTREAEERREALVAVDVARLDHVEAGLGEGRSLVMVRQGGTWRVTEPYDDVADPERVARLIKVLGELEVVDILKREDFDESSWAATGLETATTRVRLMAGAERMLELSLGKTGALDNTVYASLPAEKSGGERLWVLLRTELPAVLAEAPNLWRDLKLVRLASDQVKRVRLTTEEGQIEVERDSEGEGEWNLVKPLQTRASKERVDALLAVLLNLDITESELAAVPGVPNGTPAGSSVAPNPLKVVITTVSNEFDLTLERPKEASSIVTSAQASHRRPVFKVSAEALSELWCEPNSLRDDHLARVTPEQAVAAGIRSQAFPEVVLKQENQSWLLQRQGRWIPANGDRVAALFKALNETRVREFASDSAAELGPYGLDKPFMSVWWDTQAGEGQPVKRSELLFGQNAEGTAFYVKLATEPFVYRVSADVLPQFPPDAVKWQGRGVLRFSLFDLKRITLAVGAAPPVVLRHDAMKAEWTGAVGDQDVTPMLDRVKADALAGTLGKLSVDDWSRSLAEGLKALEQPTIRIQVELQPAGQANAPSRVHDLKFAPTQAGADTAIYYGRVDEQPDVFYISRETLRNLLKPVFKDGATR